MSPHIRDGSDNLPAISGQKNLSGYGRTPPARPGDAGDLNHDEGVTMLVKVFPIKLQDGMQDKVEAVVREFAPIGPGAEEGTLSFRVYRDPAKPDYLLFVEHFADQAAYDAHTSSPAYLDLIAGQFASMIVEFTELDHELVVSL
jgi:quinol monooxygenase YgiN